LEILDGDDIKANEVDDNKPIEVDTPRLKRTTEDKPTLKRKLRAFLSSLPSDLTELSQIKREQMIDDKQYKIMQFGIEERKLELLEQESTFKIEKLKAEAEWEHLNVQKEQMKFKVDLLHQRVQLLKEGVSQDDIDSALPILNDLSNTFSLIPS